MLNCANKAGYERFSLVGQSAQIKQLRATIEKVANTASRILITGPGRSGKEVVARQIHTQSARKEARCGGALRRISAENADTELFGSEMLASGRRIVGLFEQAIAAHYILTSYAIAAETQSRLVRAVAAQTFRL